MGRGSKQIRDFAIKMDFEPAEDNYHKIGISFPQDIETEGILYGSMFPGTILSELSVTKKCILICLMMIKCMRICLRGRKDSSVLWEISIRL